MTDTPERTIYISQPSLGDEEWQALKGPLDSGWLTHGPKVTEFEKRFAALHKVEHALAVTSCTTGLHLALVGMNIGPGDEVLVPAFTWIATANVVLYCGATPVFVDVDPITYNIAPSQIANKVTERTKAIIPVHLFGLCADMDAIKRALPDHVKIVEDAACAAGAIYKGEFAGSLGDCGVFSFHPRKSITTGEGGMITTNDDHFAAIGNQLRNHGATISEQQRHEGPRPYLLPDFNLLGFNYRMTDLQGAVGIVQLGKLEKFIEERSSWATFYRAELNELDWITVPQEPEDGRHAWQAFVCTISPEKAPVPRNEIMDQLQKMGISTRPGTHAVHTLNLYKEKYGFVPDDFPNSWACDQNTIALPLHNRMTAEDYNYVIECLKKF